MEQKKYKIKDLAKDLNVTPNYIAAIVNEYLGIEKKTTSSLVGEEIDIVMEKVSQENQVASFESFFNERNNKKTTEKQAGDMSDVIKTETKPKAEGEVKFGAEVKNETETKAKSNADTKGKTEIKTKASSEVKSKSEIKYKEDSEVKNKAEMKIKSERETRFKTEKKSKSDFDRKNDAKGKSEEESKVITAGNEKAEETGFKAKTESGAKVKTEDVRSKINNEKNAKNRTDPNSNSKGKSEMRMKNKDPEKSLRDGRAAHENEKKDAVYSQRSGVSQQNVKNTENNNNFNMNSKENKNIHSGNSAAQNRNSNFQQSKNAENKNISRNQHNTNSAIKQTQKTPSASPSIDLSNIKTNAPPVMNDRKKGEIIQRGEQVTKYVDTRGSYINLDKYNERYETIAQVNDKKGQNAFTKKQKINQKSQQKKGQYGNKNMRETETQKLKRLELERARKQQLRVQIPNEIVLSELASRLKVTATEVIKKLFSMGEMCNINQVLDFDTAALVADEFGAKVEREKVVTIEERLFEEVEDNDDNLQQRSPVVVVMGHVDHGKTSLLDKIRHANVAEGEAGGITQHIGAYRVNIGGRDITFLDTPGHEAFTAMRARGASITDIAVLVVAADDGIMPQTVEAIHHAKAAGVQIIVAINKMDKEGANPERIKQQLTEHDVLIEDWGGDVICVPVSAKKGTGINDLLEMIILTADVLDLKANPDRLAQGTVIEARLDKGRGPIATLLVQKGTLRTGNFIIAGTTLGRVRVMRDDKGRTVKEAGPSVPVEVMGLDDVPSAGDTFAVVEDEKLARELVEKRKFDAKEEQFKLYQKVTLDNLFAQIEEGEMKELPIIVKADVQGSVEAVKQSLEKLSNDEIRVKVIHGGVGAVSESDVMLASASNAIIIGFNVRPNPAAAENAKHDGVDIRLYRIIYDAIEEVQTAMKGMLAPKFREVDMGRAEVRMIYKITGTGQVAGVYVQDGKITRNGQIRVVRDGIVVADDKIAGLKRFKDDAKEVAAGYECGVSLEKFSDVKEGDIFEAYVLEEYAD